MIRINLLDAKPGAAERMHTVLHPGGSSFLSRRELALAGAFLALASVILATQIHLSSDAEESAAAASTTAPEPPPAPETPAAGALAEVAEDAPDAAADEPEAPAAEPGSEIDFIDARGPAPAARRPAPVETAKAVPPAPKAAPESAPEAGPGAPAAEPSASPRELTAITVEPSEDVVDVHLTIPDAPEPTWFRLDDPPRVAFDLSGAVLVVERGGRVHDVGHPLLDRVRVAQNRLDPPKVRVVFEVPQTSEVSVDRSADGVHIRLTARP